MPRINFLTQRTQSNTKGMYTRKYKEGFHRFNVLARKKTWEGINGEVGGLMRGEVHGTCKPEKISTLERRNDKK